MTEEHGTRRRRSWRKLQLATGADTGRIVASVLTGHDPDDGGQIGPLLERVDGPAASFTADGAYDRVDVDAEVTARCPKTQTTVPPRSPQSSAVTSASVETAASTRDRHLRTITGRGHMSWQRSSG
ncbi:transposase [Muricoccus aerilatus]|uniref:transposase n=1 Tax=Muricoccus aerilatus TaxID=452982 RepID=UPI003B5880BF